MYSPSRRAPQQWSVYPFHTLSIWKRVLLNGVRLLQLGLVKLLDRLAPAELRFLLIHSYNTTIPHLHLVQSCQKTQFRKSCPAYHATKVCAEKKQ